jgi:serine/threonine protein kinase
MSLARGMRLGPYEIGLPLGRGGMGEVYRAADTKLDREVAIKVLPAAFAEDAERLARFEREAKLLASLNQSVFRKVRSHAKHAGFTRIVEMLRAAGAKES